MTQPRHLQADDDAVAVLAPKDPAWEAWDTAWTKQARRLAARDDLTVVVAPGAANGSPACYYLDHARIEVDAAYLGGDPAITDPKRAAHKQVVATGFGLLTHEAGHAKHSQWRVPPGTSPIVADAALLLEESRAEGQHRRRRRADRRWLRQAVLTLLLRSDPVVDDVWRAGTIAGLLLARADARILTAKDVRAARAAVTAILGRDRLRQLRDVWRAAHDCADDDATTMIKLGRRWCRILGVDLTAVRHAPWADAGLFPGRLAAALNELIAGMQGITVAQLIDHQTASRHGAPATWTRRTPTDAERAAARDLGRRLRRARTRHRETTTAPSPVPPGRLRTRQAITVDAQLAAGMIPTADRWQRRTALPPHTPVLRLAVIVDVSASMDAYLGPLSTAAWILANGARRTDAITTTIAFSDHATLVIPPRERPHDVLDMGEGDGSAGLPEAVVLADQLLDLRRPSALRMLAVVSDGDLPARPAIQKLITTLRRSGCAVLWLRPKDLPGHTFTGATTIEVADPLHAVDEICAAAVTALENA